MRANRLYEKLKDDEPTIGTRILNTWPGIIEVIGKTGALDYVEFSGEYAPYDLYDLDNMARASELVGLSTMIKMDSSAKTFLAQRALGSGIQNLLFTDIRTVEDARECVKAVRAETPKTKGTNPCAMRRNVGYLIEPGSVEYVEAMDQAVVALMIEKKPAVENLEEILAVEGIDMVQFGPCDYAMSIGTPGQTNGPKVKKAERKMIQSALKAGVAPRVEINHPGEAEEYLDLGVRHFNLGIDIVILHDWLKKNAARLGAIVTD